MGNSTATALPKAKRHSDSEIVVASLREKLMSAVEDGNEDIVKSLLCELRRPTTSDIFVKSLSSSRHHEKKKKEERNKVGIWKEAMYTAIEKDTKHSEEILNLLLDCDILVWLEVTIGCPILHRLRDTEEVDKYLRLIEVLLKSGKIDVNATDEYGRTALHWVKEEKILSLLIRYDADVNRKDEGGKTPLMPELGVGISILLTILDEAGTVVDLDATDCDGRTVLMYGVMRNRPDVVQLLLDAGASVNLSDHLGFTALHHALYMSRFGKTLQEYDQFPRNSEELKKRKEIFTILYDVEKSSERCKWYSKNKNQIELINEIVDMLLQRPDINVNALSFEKFSPLDIAEGWIPEIPSYIKDALKEKGAKLNVFAQTESRSTGDFHLDLRCRLSLQRLVCDAFSFGKESRYRDFIEERLLTLIERFQEQIVSGKDQKGRTALHLATIASSIVSGGGRVLHDRYLPKTIVEKLISLDCSVDATDMYGRTPFHYADYRLQDLLKSKGADASIKDNDGNTAVDEKSQNTDEQKSPGRSKEIARALDDWIKEMHLRLQTENKSMELNAQFNNDTWRELKTKLDPKVLWEGGKYAFCHSLVNQITKEAMDLMSAIAKEIERLDPRFEIRPEFVGSSVEGTRICKPDEFDFCFVLTKISELCQVSQSPELPAGFVHLKRKPRKVDETSEFDSFFTKDELLNTEKLRWQFSVILSNALFNVESQQSFDWNLAMKQSRTSKVVLINTITSVYDKLKKVANIKMIKPLHFTSVNAISIDVVPCIHVDGWWPDEAISNVSDELKKFGCNLIFDRPQEVCPWVPYSEVCARISFSKAESGMIKQSCANAKESYMIGKTMIKETSWSCGYILKNSLLYCIEALTPTSENASQLGLTLEELETKFHQMDRYLWLKCLMKCYLEFVSQDFCPCYFLPSFSSQIPIGKKYLKVSSLSWMNDESDLFAKACKQAFALFCCTSNDTSDSCNQLPAPDPLWERFDRNQLIASLCEIAYK